MYDIPSKALFCVSAGSLSYSLVKVCIAIIEGNSTYKDNLKYYRIKLDILTSSIIKLTPMVIVGP